MIKKRRINFPIVPPKKTSGKIEVPEYLPKLTGLQIWVGRRNAGKTVAATNLIKRYMDVGGVERVILVSPTYKSNAHTFAPLQIDEAEDVLEPTKDAVTKIKEKLAVEVKEWEEYQHKKKRYQEFRRRLRSRDEIPAELLLQFIPRRQER